MADPRGGTIQIRLARNRDVWLGLENSRMAPLGFALYR